jgi:glutamine---fructose-6-phosphate transaminase (isomerizing)
VTALALDASDPEEPDAAGTVFLREIGEQPDALRRLLQHEQAYAEAAAAIVRRDARLVRMVGHGSSDNAASFGVYAFGLLAGATALRDSISLAVYYGAAIDFRGSTVVALSQSGRTPDVVEYVAEARRRGALTIAVTNDEGSALADAAELVLPLAAGDEQAVAATKTYTNQLAALALLAGHVAGDGAGLADGIRRAAASLETVLPGLRPRATQLAMRFAFVGRMFVIGRGLEFATARETSLKLLETCRVAAEPLTATDLAHGPVAALDELFPVWVIAGDDETLPAVQEAARRAREAGATIVATGVAAESIEGAAATIALPPPAHRVLAPLVSVAPGQLLAWALARAKGLNPDSPDGLTKVTLAR